MDMRERNQRIVAMRDDGATYDEIGSAFGISAERANQLCRGYERDRKAKADPLYKLLAEADKVLSHNCGGHIVRRAYNVLRRKGVDDSEALRRVKLREVAGMRNAGVKTVALVAIAKELAG